MPLSRSSLVVAVGLALGATAAIAAPTVQLPPANAPTASPAGTSCSTPNKAKCISDGYIDSACGQLHKAICNPHVRDEMKAYAIDQQGKRPSVKMIEPLQTQMPKHLADGTYFKYVPTSKVAGKQAKQRKKYKVTDDALAGFQGMNMASTPPVDRTSEVLLATAKGYWRNNAWRDNGISVRSCKEYSYARSYDAARFIDAASRCKGDRECVFDVAFNDGRPGIAERVLTDEGGVAMKQIVVPKGVFQKNDLFPRDVEQFVRSNGRDTLEPTQDILDLETALVQGRTYYDIGNCKNTSCNNTRKFKNVWKWHETLHDITDAVSPAEAEEYERRRSEFRALLEKWAVAVANEVIPEQRTEQDIVLPFDMRAQDPFERFEFEHEYMQNARVNNAALKKKFGATIFNKSRNAALKQIQGKATQQQGSYHRQGGVTGGLLAMPAPAPAGPTPKKKKKASGPTPTANTNTTDSHQNPCLKGDDEWFLETAFKGPISCEIGRFLRAEWARKKAGQRSCLDLNNPRCDWTRQMFEVGILEQIPTLDAQLADEQYCDAYLDNDTFDDIPAQNIKANVTLVKKRLDATKERVELELAAVGEYRLGAGDHGQKLGKTWEGGEFLGDPEWFAAGYNYDVGFGVAPAKKNSDGLVCELAGHVHGDMGLDAWFADEKFPVVTGNVRVRAKPGNGGEAQVNAHLKMFNQSIFHTDDWVGTQTIAGGDPSSDFGVKVPGGVKPRFDVYVGVPISGELWGELMFGSSLGVSGQAPNGCDPNNPRFGVGANYVPFFGAFGVGQVGVGISGVASAGIRASITLLMLGLPIDFGMSTTKKDNKASLQFASTVGMMLSTLGGRVSLYVEFFGFDEEFEMFRWKGFGTNVPLLKLNANVALVGLK